MTAISISWFLESSLEKKIFYVIIAKEENMNEKEKKIVSYFHEKTPSYGDYHADFKTAGETEKLIEINSLESPEYILKKPFCIKILRQEETIVGEIEELELYAFGNNQEDIIDELKMDLIDLYEHYRDVKNEKLGDKPGKWEKILCDI